MAMYEFVNECLHASDCRLVQFLGHRHVVDELMDQAAWLQCIDQDYTILQPFYGPLDFVRDYPGEPVPER